MAEFMPAFESMILNEGGYVLTNDPNDHGGQTYAGISRKHHPDWAGWQFLDSGRGVEPQWVRAFYKLNYWNPMRLDDVKSQRIARTLFDFGVNAGIGTAAKLAQIIIGTTPDGRIGPKTLEAINSADEDLFIASYALAKIARYRDIVTRDKSQRVYLLGWINRTLNDLKV